MKNDLFYRNGEFVGFITSSAYGFTLHKMVALGFVQHPATLQGSPTAVESPWVNDKSAEWTIDIAGKQVPVSVHLHPPAMPIVTQDSAGIDFKQKKKRTPTVQLLKKIKSSSS